MTLQNEKNASKINAPAEGHFSIRISTILTLCRYRNIILANSTQTHISAKAKKVQPVVHPDYTSCL
ncbi:MAG: hypothetical protein IIX05_06965, partial [Selenomonadaceae bacterium]|nr:hypothetical protein [Selenomonadaceae bacterium]